MPDPVSCEVVSEHRSRMQQLLRSIAVLLLGSGALGILTTTVAWVVETDGYRSLDNAKSILLFSFTAAVTALVLLLTARRGPARAASVAMLALLFLVGTTSVVSGQPLNGPGLLVYPPLIVMAALVLGAPGNLVVTCLSMMTAVLLYAVDLRHQPYLVTAPPELTQLLLCLQYLSLTGGLMLAATRQINRAEREMDQENLHLITEIDARILDYEEALDELSASQQTLRQMYRRALQTREDEQRRLARELHDGVVQQLIALSYRLRSDGAEPDLEALRGEARVVINQLRSVIGELRPTGLEEMGLSVAIEHYVGRLAGPRLPAIVLDMERVGVHDLPPDTATCLFRVAQEALRNVVRHAEANQARLTLQKDGSRVILTVDDDGRGFDASPPLQTMLYSLAQRDHFGLVNLVERVQAIGGQVSIQSGTGQGTQLRVEAPIAWEDGDLWRT